MRGSIIAGHGAGGGNCAATIVDGAGNLSDDTTCGSVPKTVLAGFEAVLSDNGGPTKTHALLPGNNAVGVGGPCGITSDQRGVVRGSSCDAGAFEYLDCPDMVVDDKTIDSSVDFLNCQIIRTGPALEIVDGGDLLLVAGRAVAIDDGTSVKTGGTLVVSIDPDLQLAPTP